MTKIKFSIGLIFALFSVCCFGQKTISPIATVGIINVLTSDSAASIVSKITTAPRGYEIRIPAGDFYIGTNVIVMPKGVILSGAGMYQTRIKGGAIINTNGPIVVPGDNCSIYDLTIESTNQNGVVTAPVGSIHRNVAGIATQQGWTNVIFSRVRTIADSDSIYVFNTNKCEALFYDCKIQSQWDAVTVYSNTLHFLEFRNCDIVSIGGSPYGTNQDIMQSRCVNLDRGHLKFANCRLIATNQVSGFVDSLGDSAPGQAVGIEFKGSPATGGFVEFIDSTIVTATDKATNVTTTDIAGSGIFKSIRGYFDWRKVDSNFKSVNSTNLYPLSISGSAISISGWSNIVGAGTVTASAFVGDGSGLTGIAGGSATNAIGQTNGTGYKTKLVQATVQISNGAPTMIIYADGLTNAITSSIGITSGNNLYGIGSYTGLVGYANQVFASFNASNAVASRLSQTGADKGVTNTGIAVASGSNASGFGTISAGDNITTTAGIVGLTGQFGGVTVTGPVSHFTATGTNGNVTRDEYSLRSADNTTNAHGLFYFSSGGTNAIDMWDFSDFMLTNNMATNITLWLTNGYVNKRFGLKILGPTNGNNYTLTLYSANSWLMSLDRNNATNGGTGTIITVTNNQSVEFDGWITKTPTNPIIDLVYSRKTL